MTAPAPAWLEALAHARDPDGPPALVFDLDAVDARLAAIAAATARHGAHALVAAKALPHPALLARARAHGLGVDVAGPEEQALVGDGWSSVSHADPGRAPWQGGEGGDLTISCESVDDVARARAATPRAAIALRVSTSALRPVDDAIGGLARGAGAWVSRFGVEAHRPAGRETLRAMIAAAGDAPVGLHTHSAGSTLTSPRAWGELARALAGLADELALRPAFVDLGGGWHGVAEALDASLAAARAALAEIPLRLEPGRLVTLGAGWAIGHVRAARDLDDRAVRVVSLSRLCHLRWSPVTLRGAPSSGGVARTVVLVGPTCAEDDVVGYWSTAHALPVAAPILLGGVTGYSLAWNTRFAGVPVAEVLMGRPGSGYHRA